VSRIVVKCGGAVSASAAEGVLESANAGDQVCVVHGAGPQISAAMQQRDLPVEFVGGRRVTTPESLEVVRESFRAVNAALCASIGPLALGLMGDEVGLEARLVPELGFVGDPLPTRPPLVAGAMTVGRIPVVAPLAVGPLNVNADEMAAALAVGLGAERLLFVTDVPGVLVEGGVVPAIGADDADRLVDDGTFEGGIVPKLRAAVRAAREGVRTEIGATAVLP
jgi:acetylglutamate kinase